MTDIIIRNPDGLSELLCLSAVQRVVDKGKISVWRSKECYCLSTLLRLDKIRVHAHRTDTAHVFRVEVVAINDHQPRIPG